MIVPENDTRLRPLYPLFVQSKCQVFRKREAALEWLERNRLERLSAGFPCPEE